MKIFLLGATGPTGLQIVSQALQLGHEVTAFVRDAAKLNFNDKRLKVVVGNIFDSKALEKHLNGQDAVISALGVGKHLRAHDLMSSAVTAIIPAMKRAGVKRLVFLSAFGVEGTYQYASLIQKIVFKTFLRGIYADKELANRKIKLSGLDWILPMPVVLTDGPRTGLYRVGEEMKMKGMPKIARADVADFMLRHLEDRRWVGKEVILSY
jgi:putative NADH-flavin reductase